MQDRAIVPLEIFTRTLNIDICSNIISNKCTIQPFN